MTELRRAIGMPIGLPAAAWMIELAAMVIGTDSELLLKSRRVTPERLLRAGFNFRFPSWREAATHLANERGSRLSKPPAID